MHQRIFFIVLSLLYGMLSACGAAHSSTADIQKFADAVVREDYKTARSYWMADPNIRAEEIDLFLVALRADMIKKHGTLKGAVVQQPDEVNQSVLIVWKLEQADVATSWAIHKEEKGMRVAWSSRFSTTQSGKLLANGSFATLTPLPRPTPNAEQFGRTATTVAWNSEREQQQKASDATATTQSLQATATEQAKPTPTPERFVTARQALVEADIRARAHTWATDALLVRVAFDTSDDMFNQDLVAWDGTSRVWVFTFASPSIQKTRVFATRDGFFQQADEQSAADYKERFAGESAPFDVDLEHALDSDQAATIARENGLDKDQGRLVMFLTIRPHGTVLSTPPAQWFVGTSFFGISAVTMNSVDGTIVKNDVGPTGNPGALPTAQVRSGNAPPTVSQSPVAPTVLAGASGGRATPLAPDAALASRSAAPGRDAQGVTVSYGPENLIDGDPQTAWRIEGDGQGTQLLLFFQRPVLIQEVHIIPGYAKIDASDGTNRFTQNRRVQQVQLHFANGVMQEATLADSPTDQTIKLAEQVLTEHMVVTILHSTTHGGRDFTAVSELSVRGQECPEGACGAEAERMRNLMHDLTDPRGRFGLEHIQQERFARLTIYPYAADMDQAIAFAKREQDGWVVVTIGTAFSPEDLQGLGLPPDL